MSRSPRSGRPPRSARDRDERGAATVLVLVLAGLLLLVGAALAVVGAMVVAHRTAQAAADLAALAGAESAASGAGGAGGADPCAAAAQVAAAHGAALTGCVVDGREVRVRTRVTGPRWLGQRGDLEAEARAGPAGPAGP